MRVPAVQRFAAEADMLAPLARASGLLAEGPMKVLFEVTTRSAGIPDLVLVRPSSDPLAERGGAGPLSDVAALAVMTVLGSQDTDIVGMSLTSLATSTGVSAARLRQRVLPSMIDAGHVLRPSEGCWTGAYRRRSPADLLITIEAKRADWKRALAQAARHVGVADLAYVAMDPIGSARAASNADWFRRLDVGLLTVHDALTVTVDVTAPAAKGGPPRLRRELLAEHTAAMISEGRCSGQPPLVFGRSLLATTGPDPRLTALLAS